MTHRGETDLHGKRSGHTLPVPDLEGEEELAREH